MVDMTTNKNILNRLVVGLVGGAHAEAWWNSPNRAFDMKTPNELMTEETWTEVRDYLMHHAYGGGS